MSYKVYRSESFSGNDNHVLIYVDTQGSAGTVFHVTGDLRTGMRYESKRGKQPDQSANYVPGSLEVIGTIDQSHLTRFEGVCSSVPPPARQFKGPRRIDPSKPIYQCGDWVKDAVEALFEDGVLKKP